MVKVTEDKFGAMNVFLDSGAISYGHFVLSSGKHSDVYVQCARVLEDPRVASKLCGLLAEAAKISISDIESVTCVAGPAIGGVIVSYETARQLEVRSVFCERNKNHNLCFRRGFKLCATDRVLVVEDVITTCNSALQTAKCIEDQGAKVLGICSLIDRRSKDNQGNQKYPILSIVKLEANLYEPNQVPEELKKIQISMEGSNWKNAQ